MSRLQHSFLLRVSTLTYNIDLANLSARPSVRPLRYGILCKRFNQSINQSEKYL